MLADKDKPSADETLPEKPKLRIPGRAKGKIWVSPDFDAPLTGSLIREFEK